jgi:sugar phosphate isomerase/epimerase
MADYGAQTYGLGKVFNVEEQQEEVVSALAAAGYKSIETYPRDVARFRATLERHGMTCCGVHVNPARLRDIDSMLPDLEGLGTQDVCSSGPISWNDRTPADFAETIVMLNEVGRNLRSHGVYLHYHNHEFEFEPYPESDRRPVDDLLAGFDSEAVDFCLDLGWVQRGGMDPVEFLQAHGDRVSFVHLRDWVGEESTALGEGDLPQKPLLELLDTMPHLRARVVEMDPIFDDPLGVLARSLEHIRSLGH